MPGLELDGFAVLGGIARNPSCFPDIRADVVKVARALVTSQLKSKTIALAGLRGIREATGDAAFDLIMDGLPDPQVKALVGKLDKNHPDLKAAQSPWLRERLRALASGAAEPAEKQATKAKAAPKPPTAKKEPSKRDDQPQRLQFKSAGATRKR